MSAKPLAVALVALSLAACQSGEPPAATKTRIVPPPPVVESKSSAMSKPADDHAAPHAAAAKSTTTSTSSSKVFPYDVHEHTLDNGLKIYFIPMPSHGLSAYWSIVRTGSRDEVEKGVTGFAHFFEHMMFRGTEKLPGPEYDKIVNGMGADANAFTTDDFTAYHLGLATEDLPTVVKIEADRFANLKYDEGQFKTESGAVYGEYRKGRTSPFDVLFESLQNAAFDKHTYKHTTIGFEADIQAMPGQYDYSKGFFQRFYRPDNVVIVVAGDGDENALLSQMKEQYGSWKAGYQPPAVPPEPEQKAQRRIDVPFEGQTLPILTIAFKGEKLIPTDRKMVAGSLMGELIFGETSPLYKKLVLQEQRVESLFQGFGYNRDPGLWSVFALVKDPADVAAVEGEIWSAIATLKREGVSQEQLDDIRARMKYGFLSSLTTPGSVCENVAQLVAITGGMDVVEQLYGTIEQVTPADVQAAANTWLVPEHSTVAVVHPKDQPVPAPASAEAPVLMPVPQDPNVAFRLWFKTGSQDDPAGKEGLAALTGAMLSEGGTESRSYDEILAALYPLAANYHVSVDKEMTVVTGLTHRDNVGAFYDIFMDAVLRPGFRADDFERLRDSAVNSIEKELRYSSDEELGKATLMSRVFAGTPYAHLEEGTVASLKKLTVDDVRDFWSKHYTKDNVVIALGGGYPQDLQGRLVADLARLPSGKPEAVPAPQPPAVTGRHVTIVQKPGPSTAISFGVPIDVHRGSREYYALWIANSWLGEHRNSSSHLYQVIRDARGMNYGDYSYIEAYPNGGRLHMPPSGVGRRGQMFEVWIRPVPENQTLFALRAALREVELLGKNGLTQEQFDFTRKFLKNYSLHFAETTGERLAYAVDDRFFGVADPGDLALFRKMMDEVTLEEVNAAVHKWIQADNLQIAIVTQDADKLAEAIASDAPSPMDYGDVKKPDELLAEDKIIQSWPLKATRDRIEIVPVEQMFEK